MRDGQIPQSLVPVESALLPFIEETYHEYNEKGNHRQQGKQAKISQDGRPRVEEDYFDVEDQKEHCNQVVLNRESSTGVGEGDNPRFVGLQFLIVTLSWTEQRGQTDGNNAESGRQQDQYEKWQIVACHLEFLFSETERLGELFVHFSTNDLILARTEIDCQSLSVSIVSKEQAGGPR